MQQRLYHSNFYDIYRMLTRKKFKSNINRKWETFIIYKAHLRLDLGAIAQCFWCESRCAATTRRFMRIFWTFTYYCRTFAKINRLTSIVERQKLFGNFISRVMPPSASPLPSCPANIYIAKEKRLKLMSE